VHQVGFIYKTVKTCLGIHVKCPILSSDFNQICCFSTGFRKSFQYQISRKSVRWEPLWYKRTHGMTDRHDEAKKSFSLFMPSRLKRQSHQPFFIYPLWYRCANCRPVSHILLVRC